jgi:hypothetical protein
MGTSRRTQPVDAERARFDYIKTEELKFRNPIIGELVKGLLWIGVDRPRFRLAAQSRTNPTLVSLRRPV